MLCPICEKTITDGKVFCNYCGYCFDADYHAFMMNQEIQRSKSVGWITSKLHENGNYSQGKKRFFKRQVFSNKTPQSNSINSASEKAAVHKIKNNIIIVLIVAGVLAIGSVLYLNTDESVEEPATNNMAQAVSCEISEHEGVLGGTVFDFAVLAPEGHCFKLDCGTIVQTTYSDNGKAKFSVPATAFVGTTESIVYVYPEITVLDVDGNVIDVLVETLQISPDDIA